MHVKAKQIAFLGLLAAMVTVLIIFASFFEMNTLFLLAAAAYLVGVAIREFGLRIGAGFFVACILLGLLLSPNKLYVLTYTGLSLYIVWNEVAYWLLSRMNLQKYKKTIFWITKFVFFNILYVPIFFLFPQLFFSESISKNIFWLLLLVGQLGWFVYDKAYEYFQAMVWGKLRNKIRLLNE
jgi:hypothetical protein